MELFLFLRIDNINNNIKTEQTWDKEENFG